MKDATLKYALTILFSFAFGFGVCDWIESAQCWKHMKELSWYRYGCKDFHPPVSSYSYTDES